MQGLARGERGGWCASDMEAAIRRTGAQMVEHYGSEP